MKLFRVSIVIPVYNEAAHLPACLDAIAAQSVKPFEVIVVDNNSTDGTAEIAAAYPFVRVLHESRQGVVHARNRGFDAAKGDIIGRIDADSRLSVDWVHNVQKLFASDDQAAAVTGRCYFYDYPFRIFTSRVHDWTYNILQARVAGTPILWGSNMAVRKSAWRDISASCSRSSDIPEDIDMSLVIQNRGLKIVFAPQLLADVSLRRGNMSPAAVERYLRWWPRVFRLHNRTFAANVITICYVLTCAAAVAAWPLAYVAIQGQRKGFQTNRKRTSLLFNQN